MDDPSEVLIVKKQADARLMILIISEILYITNVTEIYPQACPTRSETGSSKSVFDTLKGRVVKSTMLESFRGSAQHRVPVEPECP